MKDKIHPKYFPCKVYHNGEVVMPAARRCPNCTSKCGRARTVLHRQADVCRLGRPRREVPEEVRRELLRREEEVIARPGTLFPRESPSHPRIPHRSIRAPCVPVGLRRRRRSAARSMTPCRLPRRGPFARREPAHDDPDGRSGLFAHRGACALCVGKVEARGGCPGAAAGAHHRGNRADGPGLCRVCPPGGDYGRSDSGGERC